MAGEAIINGFATALCVQDETTFAAASVATKYNVAGKTSFNWTPVLEGGGKKVDVWRNETRVDFTRRHYRGAIALEIGINVVTKQLLAAFFELVATNVIGGGITEYVFRPRRLSNFGSLKFGVDYDNGGGSFALHGVVLDSISIDVRVKQTARVAIGFKCADVETLGAAFSTGAQTVETRVTTAVDTTLSIDSVAIQQATELAWRFSNEKAAAAFGDDGKTTRFVDEKAFMCAGEFAEYVNTESGVRALTNGLSEAPVISRLTDTADTARYLEIEWPRAAFEPNQRDAITRNDLIDRVQFTGLQDSELDTDNEPLITIRL